MDTRNRALDLGRHYLQTLGFNGFSFQTIADELGIKKASLHYYFASKEDMGLAILEDYEKAFDRWTTKVKALPAHKKIEQMFQIFFKMALDNKKICPVGVLCADFNTISKRMKKKLLAFHQKQRNWLKTTLRQGVREKSFHKNLNISASADLIMITIQGGVQMARLRGEIKSFKSTGKSLIVSLST